MKSVRLSRGWIWRGLGFAVGLYALVEVASFLIYRAQKVPYPVSTIHQAVEVKRGKIRLFAVGDTGTGDKDQLRVAQAMERICRERSNSILEGILLLGDNFYPHGIGSAQDPEWLVKVMEPYGDVCLRQAPIFAVLGNHDYEGNPQAQVDYSLKNSRWHMPHRFYKVDFPGIARVVAIDSNLPDFCFNPEHCMFDFYRESIATADAPWILTMAHHPVASASDHGTPYAGGLFGYLMRPFVCGRSNFWISGHSHHLEHRRLDGCGTDFLIAGGGGGDLYDVREEQPEALFLAKKFGFAELEITADRIDFAFFDDQAREIYRNWREKSVTRPKSATNSN